MKNLLSYLFILQLLVGCSSMNQGVMLCDSTNIIYRLAKYSINNIENFDFKSNIIIEKRFFLNEEMQKKYPTAEVEESILCEEYNYGVEGSHFFVSDMFHVSNRIHIYMYISEYDSSFGKGGSSLIQGKLYKVEYSIDSTGTIEMVSYGVEL